MATIDGRVPEGTTEINTGWANSVWYIGGREPYVLKHYSDPARAANEAAALALLTHHRAPTSSTQIWKHGRPGPRRAPSRPNPYPPPKGSWMASPARSPWPCCAGGRRAPPRWR
ncbi:hypothetical protein [Streptomyces lavendulae]|uniref:hypothetical protein n=1 Tax=Streptomyces lavendulae TaxID=1914 RepID=UPI0033F6691D